jgi:hypothetical protein
MATIVTIIIGVTYLLGKRNDLPREVFCWLVAGEKTAPFFSRQKSPKCALGGGGVSKLSKCEILHR